ncbi:MAG TPA: hypothetical protein DCQ06_13710 [Myxococcales bacterium]|nr:hypothetical protein [Myxococcales bacterium]HAN32646.1 hypothetical protein [Myxococcales bacterium]
MCAAVLYGCVDDREIVVVPCEINSDCPGEAGSSTDAGSAGKLIQYVIPGNEVDPRVSSGVAPNYIYLDTRVAPQNRLLVHLPGSFGNPSKAQKFLEVAAGTGAHVIGLKYNNSPTIGLLCSNQPPSCYETMRLDIIYGNGVRIDKAHSIVNRLSSLLRLLDESAPQEGWGQFLDGDAPRWSKIALSGHSQGGGHAALIARDHVLDRVILFNSPTDAANGSPAPWLLEPHVTSDASYFAFFHPDDKGVYRTQLYELMGFGELASPVNVDTTPVPYNGAHILYSQQATDNAHAVVITDSLQPLDEAGQPVFASAWRYLVGETD